MTEKDMAKELVLKFAFKGAQHEGEAKKYALIAVDYIINANPHSNPLNTDVHSTMNYWREVKREIQNL